MILRVVRGRVRSESTHEFYKRVSAALPVLHAHEGLLDARVGRQQAPGGDDFVFVTVWRDLDAIYRWVGSQDLLWVPAVPGGYEDLVDASDVQHYEIFEPDPGSRAN